MIQSLSTIAGQLHSHLLAPPLAIFVCCVVCAASVLYFADRRMKTHDLWVSRFPGDLECARLLFVYAGVAADLAIKAALIGVALYYLVLPLFRNFPFR